MRAVYETLLNKIERRNFDVMHEPVQLGKAAKMHLRSARPRAGKARAGASARAEKGRRARRGLRGPRLRGGTGPARARGHAAGSRARCSAAAPTASSIRRPASCSTTASISSWAAITRRSRCCGSWAWRTGCKRRRACRCPFAAHAGAACWRRRRPRRSICSPRC